MRLRRAFKSMIARPKTVLIAEDEALLRADTAYFLIEAGYAVIEAAHAKQAIEILEERFSTILVLFTDIHMPGQMNGLHLAHHTSRNWPHIGILIASGHARPLVAEMPAQGRFLRKPYEPQAVLKHLEELIVESD